MSERNHSKQLRSLLEVTSGSIPGTGKVEYRTEICSICLTSDRLADTIPEILRHFMPAV